MVVTINSDASFNAALREGGFAYWIKSDVGHKAAYGSFKVKVQSIEVAELMAITKAMKALVDAKWKNVNLLIINTDCLNVIHYMTDNEHAIRRWKIKTHHLDPIADLFCNMYKKHFPLAEVSFRHVKAHTEFKNDPRKYVNAWCDLAAKKGLGQKLEELKKAGQ